MTRHREVELALDAEVASVRVVRDGEERLLEVPTTALDGRGRSRALVWAGALLHAPHRALAAQRGVDPTGVYVAWTWHGSPASRYKLRATRRIVAVDGTPTPDLDSFLTRVSEPGRSTARLKTIDLEGRVAVITLKLDPDFWPTVELRRGPEGWTRLAASATAVEAGRGMPLR